MVSEEKFKHYIWYLVAKLKSKIKKSQNNKNYSYGEEDDTYKMGYLMALYNVIDEIKIFSSDFNIEMEEIGLGYNIKEILINFLTNLSYISNKSYQKKINFKEAENYDGEFNQLNDLLVDQCEILHVLGKFEERYEALLSKFYCHLEPFFQDYEGLYESQREESWKEIVEIAKDILEAFDFKPNQKLSTDLTIYLNKEEYNYLSQATFLPGKFKKMMTPETQREKSRLVSHPYWVDEIRNLCGIQLQVAGFNEKYEPTPEAKILEDLVDKFFTG